METGQSNIILDIEESRGTRKFFFRHCLYYSVIKVLRNYYVMCMYIYMRRSVGEK